MLLIQRILIFCGIIFATEGARKCPELTKAHLTRCDMYYRCTVLPSDNIIWIPRQCPNGLVFDANYKTCVIPGDDWECQLDESESKSSNLDEDGAKNLTYLRAQIKSYNPDGKENLSDDNNPNDDDENVLITMSNNGTMTFESKTGANLSESENLNSGEFESSGDGGETSEGDSANESNEQNLEDKSGYESIPDNSNGGIVTSQLQRLAQLIKKVNYDQNLNQDLTPDDLNQFLALHKLKFSQNLNSNLNAEPVPQDGLVKEHHLQQILDLQKKLNRLAATRNRLSTPPPPVKYTVQNGYYPSDATTVHIQATNGIKNPDFPETGYTSSQIVVNRPGGSVVFKLPQSNYPQATNKHDPQISEETLKTLLELSKQMVNQAPNTPSFVHSLPPPPPPPNNGFVQPIFQPILYGVPWDHFSMTSGMMSPLEAKKHEKFASSDQSMEKVTSVNNNVAPMGSEGDDSGTTTVVHNHIPITISHPNPSQLYVNRNPMTATATTTTTTTERPYIDRYDSYGNVRPSQQTNLNDYYSYPPYQNNFNKNPAMQLIQTNPFSSNPTPFSAQPNYDSSQEQPQFIQIGQSRPDRYGSVYPSKLNIVSNGPIPTYASIDGGYTQKIYSTYTPQPYLSDSNVNSYVAIDRKPYPTVKPTNYVPIVTASGSAPTYANMPQTYGKAPKPSKIMDKLDDFAEDNEPNENIHGESFERIENNDEYVNSNVEQNNNDDDNSNGNNNNNENYEDDGNSNANGNENVMDLLANYDLQIKTPSNNVLLGIENSVESKEANQLTGKAHKQFVNLNGNFMSLETYQQTIEPFLQKNSAIMSQIEVLTCATGVRQANSSDCTKYFVCNEKNGKILSYSCPPYTAFNSDTKICNADTYSNCLNNAVPSTSITYGNGKIGQQKLQQSLIEANRIKAEAIKTQQLAQLIRQETNKILNSQRLKLQSNNNGGIEPSIQTVRPTKPTRVEPQRPNRRPNKTANRVTAQKQTTKRPAPKPQGKRKIPCKMEGKLVDNLSQNHYFLCFRDQTKTMRARRLQCPAKLVFCSATLICTASERCSSNQR